jgi:hypothetical protein
VSQDFLPLIFFHQSTHLRVLIHRLKPFHIWFWICREIWDIHLKWLAFVVSMRPGKRIWLFQWDHGSWFRSFIETAGCIPSFNEPTEAASAVRGGRQGRTFIAGGENFYRMGRTFMVFLKKFETLPIFLIQKIIQMCLQHIMFTRILNKL